MLVGELLHGMFGCGVDLWLCYSEIRHFEGDFGCAEQHLVVSSVAQTLCEGSATKL